MAPGTQLRRRQRAKPKPGTTAASTPDPATPEPTSWPDRLLPVAKVLAAMPAGLLLAASCTRDDVAMGLFGFSIIALFLVLLRVFMSILRQNDRRPLSLPTVYNADGTVIPALPMTVFDHDNKIATYFAAEMPALAATAAWVFLWMQIRQIFPALAVYLLYRVVYHPLFRIHIWREEGAADLERPFGGVPLFKANDDAPVRVVAGMAQFQRELSAAPSGSLVVIDCSAIWCAPCRAMAPVFERFAEQFGPAATFLSVDVDTSRDIAAHLNVTSVPSFFLYRDSERVQLLRGPSPEALRAAIEENIKRD